MLDQTLITEEEAKAADKKLYKHNPVVHGYFVESTPEEVYKISKKDVSLPFGEFEWDCLNAIYHIVQQRLWHIEPSQYFSHSTHFFTYNDITAAMEYDGNDYVEKINAGIDKIYKANIVLKNFIHPEDGKKYKIFRTRLIDADGVYKETKENRIMINFSRYFMACMMRHSANFTVIDLKEERKIKGKFAKPIFERLKSKQDLYSSYFFSIKELNEMFSTQDETLRRHKERIKRIVSQNEGIFEAKEYADGIEITLLKQD